MKKESPRRANCSIMGRTGEILGAESGQVNDKRAINAAAEGSVEQREFHAVPHGVDAFSANFDAVAQTPHTLLGFRGSASAARTFRAANRNDCVIVFAIQAAGSHGILERIDRQ